MDKFSLTIHLGNDAMQHPQDVAGALARLADKLANRSDQWFEDEGGVLFDLNGQSVGTWSVE